MTTFQIGSGYAPAVEIDDEPATIFIDLPKPSRGGRRRMKPAYDGPMLVTLDAYVRANYDRPAEEYFDITNIKGFVHDIIDVESNKIIGKIPEGLAVFTQEGDEDDPWTFGEAFGLQGHTYVGDPASIRELNRLYKIVTEARDAYRAAKKNAADAYGVVKEETVATAQRLIRGELDAAGELVTLRFG